MDSKSLVSSMEREIVGRRKKSILSLFDLLCILELTQGPESLTSMKGVGETQRIRSLME